MSSGRVGQAFVLTCFFTAGYGRHRKLGVGFRTASYGRHRSQWVKRKISSVQTALALFLRKYRNASYREIARVRDFQVVSCKNLPSESSTFLANEYFMPEWQRDMLDITREVVECLTRV